MFRSGTQEQRKQRNTHKQLSKLPVYKETKIHTLQNSISIIISKEEVSETEVVK